MAGLLQTTSMASSQTGQIIMSKEASSGTKTEVDQG